MPIERLAAGQASHRTVQSAFLTGLVGALGFPERQWRLLAGGRGRVDLAIEVDGAERMPVIIEIKGTDWDKIPAARLMRNLRRHLHQLQGYLDTSIEELEAGDWTGIIGSLLYPARPASSQTLATIEAVAGEQAIMATWYEDVDWHRSACLSMAVRLRQRTDLPHTARLAGRDLARHGHAAHPQHRGTPLATTSSTLSPHRLQGEEASRRVMEKVRENARGAAVMIGSPMAGLASWVAPEWDVLRGEALRRMAAIRSVACGSCCGYDDQPAATVEQGVGARHSAGRRLSVEAGFGPREGGDRTGGAMRDRWT